MKILITYERADILRLLEKELTAQGITFKPGSLTLRGSMRVTLEAETETGDLTPPPKKPAYRAGVELVAPDPAAAPTPSPRRRAMNSRETAETREGMHVYDEFPLADKD